MKSFRTVITLGAGILLAGPDAWGSAPSGAGDRYQIELEHQTEYTSSVGSGSSSGRDSVVVRKIAQRDGGQELEFALPDDATDKDRLISWQLPARIFIAADGTRTLLNRSELEMRRDTFLKAGNWGKEACGRWLFTWTAVKIECDPDSVFGVIDTFALQPPQLADGAMFAMPGAVGSAPMQCTTAVNGAKRCTVELPVDAPTVRAEFAESDVVVGEITGKPITPADASKARAGMRISGTIEVSFEAGADGLVTRRAVVTQMERREANGETQTSRSAEVLTRTKL